MQFYTLYYKKKALLFASLLLALSSNVSAQQVDAVLYEVTYQFAHVRDTNNRQKLYREAFVLRIGRNASEFASLTNQQNAKNIKEQVEHATATGQSEINLGAWKPATPEKIFIWQTKHKLYKTTVFRSTTYKIEYLLETMQWKISRATKTVAGYKCQLATGSWKGRTYNAWFSTDLPFPTGPWKLQGLPGVIMEATDLKNEVSFVATAVNRKD